MTLTKSELIGHLQNEVRILLHLAGKVEPAMLDYRPTAKQRSLLELLQYLTIFPSIHLRAIAWTKWDMDAWREMWRSEKLAASARNLGQIKEEIGKQPALFQELIGSLSDADLRGEIEMFGSKASRGSWLVSLVLCHYAAYRMQLFLYLKSCGREELSTLNLWAGLDAR